MSEQSSERSLHLLQRVSHSSSVMYVVILCNVLRSSSVVIFGCGVSCWVESTGGGFKTVKMMMRMMNGHLDWSLHERNWLHMSTQAGVEKVFGGVNTIVKVFSHCKGEAVKHMARH